MAKEKEKEEIVNEVTKEEVKVVDNVKEEIKTETIKNELWLTYDENTQVINVVGGCIVKTKEGLCFVPHNHIKENKFVLAV